MKRNALLRHLRRHGCYLKREGRGHSLWSNPTTGAVETVPRHTEIPNGLVRKICRNLPGVAREHEEGGFILQEQAGNLRVMRWPTGAQNSISLPPHLNCQIGDKDIVASFHTHPNTDESYLQEPTETDKRAVREDPALRGPGYAGEFVVSQPIIYLVSQDGSVLNVEETKNIFPPMKEKTNGGSTSGRCPPG